MPAILLADLNIITLSACNSICLQCYVAAWNVKHQLVYYYCLKCVIEVEGDYRTCWLLEMVYFLSVCFSFFLSSNRQKNPGNFLSAGSPFPVKWPIGNLVLFCRDNPHFRVKLYTGKSTNFLSVFLIFLSGSLQGNNFPDVPPNLGAHIFPESCPSGKYRQKNIFWREVYQQKK